MTTREKVLDLGDISVSWLGGGDFELDGGTMFGAVPKIMWQQYMPADEENYIPLLNAPLLLRGPGWNVVIDTGLGNKLSKRQKQIFRVSSEWRLVDDLARQGLQREDIDAVVLTHCDFDHAGGIVMKTEAGGLELTFPKARHIIQQREWEDVCHPNSRSAHTYWPENFSGLADSGLLELVDGAVDVVAGVRAIPTAGHTRGHQLVEISGKSGCAVHLGDLLPTHVHANPLWIMAYDNFPLEVIALKERLLPRYSDRGCWFTFYHDPFMKACTLDKKGRIIRGWP